MNKEQSMARRARKRRLGIAMTPDINILREAFPYKCKVIHDRHGLCTVIGWIHQPPQIKIEHDNGICYVKESTIRRN